MRSGQAARTLLRRAAWWLVAPALAVILVGPAGAAAPSADDLAREFICQCGCTLLLSACQGIMSCTVADELKAEIASMLGSGLGRDRIVAAFVARFGERVLSAPTRSGFNLVAWVTPFVAALGGAAALVVLLLGWTSARRRRAPPSDGADDPERSRYLDRVEQELKRFEW